MENGRIAIPSVETGGLDGQRSGHFGHCDAFTLVDVEDGEIKKV
ncbi:MAG: dinitrogenase iron-molybdenum cofactor biosynthesis protein, partial [Desulfobacterales bacterium]|nr:dinitrogenase iron-molybdenum cofactor biosynthesis protein [Desulfobacterales bacterium]